MATVTNPIILDSTGQDIKNSIDLLTANINRTASNIPYDNNLTIKGKIDVIDAKTASDIPYSSGVSVKDELDSKVSKTGDTITGNLTISSGGRSRLFLGSTNNNEYGTITMYSNNSSNHLNIEAPSNLVSSALVTLPNKAGTIALKEWTLIASDIIKTSSAVDISNYYELWIVPKIAGTYRNAPIYTINLNNFTIGNTYREGTNLILDYIVRVNSNSLTVDYNLTGWASVTFDIYGR